MVPDPEHSNHITHCHHTHFTFHVDFLGNNSSGTLDGFTCQSFEYCICCRYHTPVHPINHRFADILQDHTFWGQAIICYPMVDTCIISQPSSYSVYDMEKWRHFLVGTNPLHACYSIFLYPVLDSKFLEFDFALKE